MTVRISANAVSSVAAVLANPRGLSDEEKAQRSAYDELLGKCILKPEGHVQKPAPEGCATRLYTVTTIAPCVRYGGTRTPVICDSFEVAKHYLDENLGNLFEFSYSLAVIEAVEANCLYSHLNEVYWYMWVDNKDDPAEGDYRAIEVPPDSEGRTFQPIG